MSRDTQSRSSRSCRSVAFGVALALAGSAAPAFAEVGNADAWDLQISLSVLGIPALNVSAQASAQINGATSAANDSNQVTGIDIGNALLARVTTGVLASEAEYQPDTSISGIAGQSQVADLNLSAVGLAGASLLSLKADVIRSKSLVAGHCAPLARGATVSGLLDEILFGNGFDERNLSAGGSGAPGTGPDDSATLGNVKLSILGINVPIPLNPPPNTGVDLSGLGIAGATLLLNEQVVEGDGVSSLKKTSNGLRLTLNVLNTLVGNVVVAHSSAGIDCTQ